MERSEASGLVRSQLRLGNFSSSALTMVATPTCPPLTPRSPFIILLSPLLDQTRPCWKGWCGLWLLPSINFLLHSQDAGAWCECQSCGCTQHNTFDGHHCTRGRGPLSEISPVSERLRSKHLAGQPELLSAVSHLARHAPGPTWSRPRSALFCWK